MARAPKPLTAGPVTVDIVPAPSTSTATIIHHTDLSNPSSFPVTFTLPVVD